MAQSEGRIMLTLRSWTDSQPVDTDGVSPSGLVGGPVAHKDPGAGGTQNHQTVVASRRGRGGKDKGGPPPPPTLSEAPPQKDTVEILRGDRFEQRNFNRGEKR